jgi:hydrogenase/urease accessory protein HupE
VTRSGALALACAAGLLLALSARAHPLAPALLSLEERPDGRVEVTWKTPLQRPRGSDPRPALPDHCARLGDEEVFREGTGVVRRFQLDCGERGLVGASLGVSGLAEGGTNALLRVALADGRRAQAVLHAREPSYRVPRRQTAWDVARDYGALGIEHILTGLDHLVFVLGLMLLVGGGRLLLFTVTAFTVGHSVTLSLAALGFVRFPSALVELVIAGTILLLALELARPAEASQSWMRRAPWWMAGSFGLLHGLGFAGALAEVGLPADEIPLALLTFNLGIEVGQLLFVAVALVVGRGLAALRAPLPAWALRLPAHAMGGLAVYWCLDRGAGLIGAG